MISTKIKDRIPLWTGTEPMAKLLHEFSDGELLQKVASSRDREAFAELDARFHRIAYSLARRITGHAAMAEEAVQEAMLRIWLSAENYKTDGNARGWIIRIVARESMHQFSSGKRTNSIEEKGRTRVRSTAHQNVRENAEKAEIISALERLLKKLPGFERRMITLYYGGELSQNEIAGMLKMPQRTISLRIKQTLAELRLGLEKAGHAAVPTIALLLKQVSCSGFEAPPGMSMRLMQSIEKENVRVSRSDVIDARGWSGKSIQWMVLALFLVACLCGAAWGLLSTRQSVGDDRRFEVSKAVELEAIASAPEASEKHTPFRRHWDFNSATSHRNINVLSGAWHWEPAGGQDGSGCMRIDSDRFIAVMDLSGSSKDNGYRITSTNSPILDANNVRKNYSVGFAWEKCKRIALFKFGNISNLTSNERTSWFTEKSFLSSNWYMIESGVKSNLFVVEQKAPSVILFINGAHLLDEIVIEAVEESELPDVDKYLSALDAIPDDERKGIREMPTIQTSKGAPPVVLKFPPAK